MWRPAAGTRPFPLTRLLSAGFSPPLRYRSPASWPICLAALCLFLAAAVGPGGRHRRRVRRVCAAPPARRCRRCWLRAFAQRCLLGGGGVGQDALDAGDLGPPSRFHWTLQRRCPREREFPVTPEPSWRRARMRAARGAACAGSARVPERTTAVHSTAALRPDPDKLIRKPRSSQGWGERVWIGGTEMPLCRSPSSMRLRANCHFGNTGHINNINNTVSFGRIERACRGPCPAGPRERATGPRPAVAAPQAC